MAKTNDPVQIIKNALGECFLETDGIGHWTLARIYLFAPSTLVFPVRELSIAIGELTGYWIMEIERLNPGPVYEGGPGDDRFCNFAEEGQADFIVTLNPKGFPKTRLTAKVIIPGDAIPTTAWKLPRLR